MSNAFAVTWYEKTLWVAIFLAVGGLVFAMSWWAIRHPRRAFMLWYRYGTLSHSDSQPPGPTSLLYNAFVIGASALVLFSVVFVVVCVVAVVLA